MENFFIQFEKFVIESLEKKLKFNFYYTIFSFFLLIGTMYFLGKHPRSVWYYFLCGYFSAQMLTLILEKSDIKKRIKHSNQLIENIQGNKNG
jgi:hypothetical protein